MDQCGGSLGVHCIYTVLGVCMYTVYTGLFSHTGVVVLLYLS